MLNRIPPRMLRLMLLVILVLPSLLTMYMFEGPLMYRIMPPMAHRHLLKVVFVLIRRLSRSMGATTPASA
jgi:hypothetical protein